MIFTIPTIILGEEKLPNLGRESWLGRCNNGVLIGRGLGAGSDPKHLRSALRYNCDDLIVHDGDSRKCVRYLEFQAVFWLKLAIRWYNLDLPILLYLLKHCGNGAECKNVLWNNFGFACGPGDARWGAARRVVVRYILCVFGLYTAVGFIAALGPIEEC
jgi:hypothetical protein